MNPAVGIKISINLQCVAENQLYINTQRRTENLKNSYTFTHRGEQKNRKKGYTFTHRGGQKTRKNKTVILLHIEEDRKPEKKCYTFTHRG